MSILNRCPLSWAFFVQWNRAPGRLCRVSLSPSLQAISYFSEEGDCLTGSVSRTPSSIWTLTGQSHPLLLASAACGCVGDFQIYPFILDLWLSSSRFICSCHMGNVTWGSLQYPTSLGCHQNLTDHIPQRHTFLFKSLFPTLFHFIVCLYTPFPI